MDFHFGVLVRGTSDIFLPDPTSPMFAKETALENLSAITTDEGGPACPPFIVRHTVIQHDDCLCVRHSPLALVLLQAVPGFVPHRIYYRRESPARNSRYNLQARRDCNNGADDRERHERRRIVHRRLFVAADSSPSVAIAEHVILAPV